MVLSSLILSVKLTLPRSPPGDTTRGGCTTSRTGFLRDIFSVIAKHLLKIPFYLSLCGVAAVVQLQEELSGPSAKQSRVGPKLREKLVGVRVQAAQLLHHLKGEEEKLMTRALFVETRHPPEMWIDVEQCTDSTESRQLSEHTKLQHVDGNHTYWRPSTAAASPASYTRLEAAASIYKLWVCARDDTFDVTDDSDAGDDYKVGQGLSLAY
ncbi:hypothetical protein EYF80_002651 [Liparis tanakae]|uniref:Uncharacterized protein n=1 Tax=Liparis tanakae TaxID=230148 RepID=A0A4Z2J9J9_9TELE|nr:hypothetical protein EYF80_002651 [Liparis tanakae]